jgi:RHO1 GDP-GTP exchange protein 1/2
MHPLKNQRHEPAIMREDRLRGFIQEVFYNIDAITAHHQRMLNALFERQREQHPLVHSIADIVLDSMLLGS